MRATTKPAIKEVEGTGAVVVEPEWNLLLTDGLEIAAAREHWRKITTEMREQQTLAPSNGPAIERLVFAYVLVSRLRTEVAENGAVLKPKRGNPKAIARVSPFFTAMREAGADAERLEAELGLSPRRRTGVGKVKRDGRASTASANYLKPVAKSE